MKRMTRDEVRVGQTLYYTSFGGSDNCCKIEVVGGFSKVRKDGVFTFDAKIVDTLNWDVGGKYDWSTVGAIKKFNNCFIAPSLEKLDERGDTIRKDTVKLFKLMYEKQTGKKFIN